MRVLDLDLDFFLDDVLYWRDQDCARPDSSDVTPWDESRVRVFLETRCRLSPTIRAPGRVLTNHDEVLWYWFGLIRDRHLPVPFHLIHVDAHSDMGLSGITQEDIMGRLLHIPPDRRAAELNETVNASNFLAYALALRWLASVEFVRHPRQSDDLPILYFADNDPTSGYVEMKAYPSGEIRQHFDEVIEGTVRPTSVEPRVPFTLSDADSLTSATAYDLVTLCQSPIYTPQSADSLLSVFADYIDQSWSTGNSAFSR